MKIIGFSQDVIWRDKQANIRLIEERLHNVTADLFLLPEMFTTGFCMEVTEIADGGETLAWMKSFAQSKNAAVGGSVSVEENGFFYNRFYFVKPDGSFSHYNKRHLFSYGGEDKIYTPGKERVVVDYMGCRILLQICYDARFPVFARNKQDYDLILNVANWPESRHAAWEALNRARAIENQSYVFALNRTGQDGNGWRYGSGNSCCFFADGTVCSVQKEDLVEVTINLENLSAYRKRFPFLKDADGFSVDL